MCRACTRYTGNQVMKKVGQCGDAELAEVDSHQHSLLKQFADAGPRQWSAAAISILARDQR